MAESEKEIISTTTLEDGPGDDEKKSEENENPSVEAPPETTETEAAPEIPETGQAEPAQADAPVTEETQVVIVEPAPSQETPEEPAPASSSSISDKETETKTENPPETSSPEEPAETPTTTTISTISTVTTNEDGNEEANAGGDEKNKEESESDGENEDDDDDEDEDDESGGDGGEPVVPPQVLAKFKEMSNQLKELQTARDAILKAKNDEIANLKSKFTDISRRQKALFGKVTTKRKAAVAKAKKYKAMATSLSVAKRSLQSRLAQERSERESASQSLEAMRKQKESNERRYKEQIASLQKSLSSTETDKDEIAKQRKEAEEAIEKLIISERLKAQMRCHIEKSKDGLVNLTECTAVFPELNEAQASEEAILKGFEIEWFRLYHADAIKIPGVHGLKYRMTADDVGALIKVSVKSKIDPDCFESAQIGPVLINPQCVKLMTTYLARLAKSQMEFSLTPDLKDAQTTSKVAKHLSTGSKSVILHLNRDKIKLRNEKKTTIEKANYSHGLQIKIRSNSSRKFAIRLADKGPEYVFRAKDSLERDMIAMLARVYLMKLEGISQPQREFYYFLRGANEIANENGGLGSGSSNFMASAGDRRILDMLEVYEKKKRSSQSSVKTGLSSPGLRATGPEMEPSISKSNMSAIDDPSLDLSALEDFPVYDEKEDTQRKGTMSRASNKSTLSPSAAMNGGGGISPRNEKSAAIGGISDSAVSPSDGDVPSADDPANIETPKAEITWGNMELMDESQVKVANDDELGKFKDLFGGLPTKNGGGSKRKKGKKKKRGTKKKGKKNKKSSGDEETSTAAKSEKDEKDIVVSVTPVSAIPSKKEDPDKPMGADSLLNIFASSTQPSMVLKEKKRNVKKSIGSCIATFADRLDCVMTDGKVVKFQVFGSLSLSFNPVLTRETVYALRVLNLNESKTRIFSPKFVEQSVSNPEIIHVKVPPNEGTVNILKYVWNVPVPLDVCPFLVKTKKRFEPSRAEVMLKAKVNPKYHEIPIHDFVVKGECKPHGEMISKCLESLPADVFHWSREMANKIMWKFDKLKNEMNLKVCFETNGDSLMDDIAIKCAFRIDDYGISKIECVEIDEDNPEDHSTVELASIETKRTVRSGDYIIN